MDSGYGFRGEWRCLKAATLGEGSFTEPMQVMSFVKCHCPGRSLVANVGMAMHLAEMKPEAIYLSSCLGQGQAGVPLLQRRTICPNYPGKNRRSGDIGIPRISLKAQTQALQ
jgi:predicted metal-binding protein